MGSAADVSILPCCRTAVPLHTGLLTLPAFHSSMSSSICATSVNLCTHCFWLAEDSESGEEAMSPGTHEAAQTLAGIASEPAGHADSEHDFNEDGPHQKIRKQVLKRLDITRARTEVNYNKDFKARQFAVGVCVGVKVDRADRGAVDRAYIPA